MVVLLPTCILHWSLRKAVLLSWKLSPVSYKISTALVCCNTTISVIPDTLLQHLNLKLQSCHYRQTPHNENKMKTTFEGVTKVILTLFFKKDLIKC